MRLSSQLGSLLTLSGIVVVLASLSACAGRSQLLGGTTTDTSTTTTTALAISAQSAAATSSCQYTALSLTVTATGGKAPLSYEWYKKNTDGSETNVKAANTTSAYAIPCPGPGLSGMIYYPRVTDAAGTIVNGSNVTLSITSGTGCPTSISACSSSLMAQ